MKKSSWVWTFAAILAVAGIFLILNGIGKTEIETNTGESVGKWVDTSLVDIRTGENFMISDFNGKKVLLESFAVWCPTCTKQQIEIKKLHEEVGDSIVSISLDMDPNEDESKILNHVEENGFEWHYAVSPIEMTQSLIDEFGNSIINAPSAPMVLICENGDYRKLGGFGARNVDKLKEEIERGC